MNLTDREAVALAHLVTARQLRSEWLEWEDYPNLSEQAFKLLMWEVAKIADSHQMTAKWASRSDPAALLELAQ